MSAPSSSASPPARSVGFVGEGGERGGARERARERKEAPLALRAICPHTAGYIAGGDQEEGEIECPEGHRDIVRTLVLRKPARQVRT